MAIPGISPTVISHAFLTDRAQGIEPSRTTGGGLSSDDLFIIGALFYLRQLHKTVIEAWRAFREQQTEIHERGRHLDIRRQQSKARREEGERRVREARLVETEKDVPFRQRGAVRFHEGSYLDDSTRHLNLPV